MYYFAYGSNMNIDHMRRLCGWHFSVLGKALLKNFEFGPDQRGFFAIRPQQGSKVYGVLYHLDQESLSILDEFEGYPHIFNRIEIEVEDVNDKKYKAWVFVEGPEQFGGDYVKEAYLKRAIAGARENRLPEEWIKFLESFSNKRSHE